MTARERILEYYDALRAGDPLAPFFAESPSVVKFGITERLTGYEEIEAGLREQTRTTTDWTVESGALRVSDRPDHAWFSDDVFMSWVDTTDDREYAFDSRWSGTLHAHEDEWKFVGMHVSTTPAVDL